MFVGMMNTTTAQRPQNTIHDIKILVSNILLYVLCIYFAFYVVRVLNNPFINIFYSIKTIQTKPNTPNITNHNNDNTGNQQ